MFYQYVYIPKTGLISWFSLSLQAYIWVSRHHCSFFKKESILELGNSQTSFKGIGQTEAWRLKNVIEPLNPNTFCRWPFPFAVSVCTSKLISANPLHRQSKLTGHNVPCILYVYRSRLHECLVGTMVVTGSSQKSFAILVPLWFSSHCSIVKVRTKVKQHVLEFHWYKNIEPLVGQQKQEIDCTVSLTAGWISKQWLSITNYVSRKELNTLECAVMGKKIIISGSVIWYIWSWSKLRLFRYNIMPPTPQQFGNNYSIIAIY